MKTVSNCVEDILITQPYLEEALSRNIINYSALAVELTEPISKMLKKDVKPGAIMMALRRYSPPPTLGNTIKMRRVIQNLGDITVRSNLTDFTVKNSDTLIDNHAKILAQINQEMRFVKSRCIQSVDTRPDSFTELKHLIQVLLVLHQQSIFLHWPLISLTAAISF